MARIVLTGASGFIGQYVLRALLDNDHEVLAPVRNAAFMRESYPRENLRIEEGLFYSDEMINNYREFQPQAIVHLAAIRGDGNGSWKDYYTVNVAGTEKLVDFTLENKLDRFLYCSTVGVYGTIPSRLPADPFTAAEADGFYHKSKLQAEKVIFAKMRSEIPFVIIRPTIAYGFGDDGFLVKMINMVKKHVFPMVRKQVLIHLLDVFTFGDFVVRALSAKIPENCVVNIADQAPVQLDKLVDVIHSHFYDKKYPVYLKTPMLVHSVSEKLTDMLKMRGPHISVKLISHDWYYDTSNLENIFQMPLNNTLEKVDYYLKHNFPRNGNI